MCQEIRGAEWGQLFFRVSPTTKKKNCCLTPAFKRHMGHFIVEVCRIKRCTYHTMSKVQPKYEELLKQFISQIKSDNWVYKTKTT